MRLSSFVAIFLLSLLASAGAAQTTLTVAAASDLSATEPRLTTAFEKTNPNLRLRFVNGASTALAQQIQQGAPFDVFLSANVILVDRLKLESPCVYAVGHVAILWKDGKSHAITELADDWVRFVALPNPQLAPYGAAAQKLLMAANLWSRVQPKFVYGENVRQTLQLFDSGNADAVLTSESLIIDRHPEVLPADVVQKGGIVPASNKKEAAQKFLSWLLSPPAQEILSTFGFGKPNS